MFQSAGCNDSLYSKIFACSSPRIDAMGLVETFYTIEKHLGLKGYM